MIFHGYDDRPAQLARAYLPHLTRRAISGLRNLHSPQSRQQVRLSEIGQLVHCDNSSRLIPPEGNLKAIDTVDPDGHILGSSSEPPRIPPLSFYSVSNAMVWVKKLFHIPMTLEGHLIDFAEGQPQSPSPGRKCDYVIEGGVIPAAWGHTAWNPCHWSLEALPLLSIVEAVESTRASTILLPPREGPFEQESMAIIRDRYPSLKVVRPLPGDLIGCEELFLPDWDLPPYVSLLPRRVLDFIESVAIEAAERTHPDTEKTGEVDILFVSRSRAERRRLLGEDLLLTSLKREFSLEEVILEDRPFGEQVQLVRQGRVLAGVHGAGLVHLAWASSVGLIEILPGNISHTRHYQYASLALNLGTHYSCQIGSLPRLNEDFSLPCTWDSEELPFLVAELDRWMSS